MALGASAYTIKSHGASLARNHSNDWIMLVLLAVIEVILNVIRPFHRFVGKDMMTDLKYPLKDNTVPVWAVPVSFHCLFIIETGSNDGKNVQSRDPLLCGTS